MTKQHDHRETTNISTEGGSVVQGDVHTGGGDFVGRDKIVHNVHQVVEQAISAAEEARQAQDLARERLAEGVRTYAQRMAAIAADGTDSAAAGPYKGLLSYTLADAELFYGRNDAIAGLTARLASNRLTVLQSESGAGKSSLLHAGIAPRLLADGHLPVILRAYNRPPGTVVKQAFLPDLALAPELRDAPLRAFLRAVTGVLGPQATLVLMLDQFEEFFTLLTDGDQRTAFVAELADCVEDESLPVRWLLALRSEFFGDLASFRPRIRNPFQNDFRLNRLTQDEARDVITRPIEPYSIRYEPALVTRLLAHLSEDGEVHPPQIQLVCLALYEALTDQQADGSTQPQAITEKMYAEAGEAAGILRGHLNRVLSRSLPTRQERDLARSLLVALVSSDQRRIRRTRSDLAAALATGIVTAQNLDDVLDELVVNRLLNVEVDEASDEHSYEIAHDYLLTEVQIDPEVQAQKAAQELLNQEVEAYKRYGTLLDGRKYEIISSQLAFLRLGEIAVELLESSQIALARAEAAEESAKRTAQLSSVRARWLAVAVVVIVLIGYLALAAYIARNDAVFAKSTAEASQAEALAAKAEVERLTRGIRADLLTLNGLEVWDRKPSLALLLAVEGMRSQSDFSVTVLITEPVTPRATTPITHLAVFSETVVTSAAMNVRELLDQIGGSRLTGHKGNLNSVAFSPNGQWLATASNDKTARLWDMTYQDADPRVLVGHTGNLNAVTFSPDGHWLATASDDSTFRLWDVVDPNVSPRVLVGHEYAINSIAFSPDGRWLATTSDDSAIRLWDLTDSVASAHVLASDITAMAFSPDGSWLATASKDMTARLWNMADLTAGPQILTGHENVVTAVTFSPDGRWLVTTSRDMTARLWNVVNLTSPPQILTGLEDIVTAMAFSPDGLWLAIASHDSNTFDRSTQYTHSYGIARLWKMADPAAPPRILTGHDNVVTAVTFSPDGRWLATASRDNTAQLWNIADPTTAPRTLIGHEGAINAMTFSPDGRWLATASDDDTAWLWSMGDSTIALHILQGHKMLLTAIAFSPDGHWLATGSVDKTVRLWDLTEPAAAKSHILTGHGNWVTSIAFSPDGRWLATASRDNTTQLWDMTGPAAVKSHSLTGHGSWVTAVAFSPDGRWLATASGDHTTRLWSIAEPTATPRILSGHTDPVTAVTFSPNGRWLATASSDNTVLLWDLDNSIVTPQILMGHENGVSAIAFSPDGHWLATTSGGRIVRLWDVADPTATPHDLAGQVGDITATAFSPDGRWLVTASVDETARLWDMANPTANPSVLTGHENWVTAVAFSPDGRWLATASADNTARLWNVADPTSPPLTLTGHDDYVSAVTFSPNGRWLATISVDASVRLWTWRVEDFHDLACRTAGRNLSEQEWLRYLRDRPHRPTCEQWPMTSVFMDQEN